MKSLAIGDEFNLRPLSPPPRPLGKFGHPAPCSCLGPLGVCPHRGYLPSVISVTHTGVVERVVLHTQEDTYFPFVSLKWFQARSRGDPTAVPHDAAVAPSAEETPRVRGAGSQEAEMPSKYKLLINHGITADNKTRSRLYRNSCFLHRSRDKKRHP